VTPKRPKVEPIRNPTLFEMGKLEQPTKLVNSLGVERPYSDPGLLLGTSSFTADGWRGSFYPPGMQTRNYLAYYATQSPTGTSRAGRCLALPHRVFSMQLISPKEGFKL
jgi:hypothetical protein